MENSETEAYFVAELSIGTNKEKVELTEITTESCVARVNFFIKPFQQGLLQIHTYEGNQLISSFKPVKILVESVKQKTGEVGKRYAKLKYNGMVRANQGIVQLLHSIIYAPEESEEADVTSRNKSLRIEVVSCPICHHENILFRTLERRSMTTTTNIFGVPQYIEPYPGREFCDFNLIRITVCPECFFASNDVHEFARGNDARDAKTLPFDASYMSIDWLDTIKNRKKLAGKSSKHFFDEHRNVEQAIASYQLATITSDQIFKLDERRGNRYRNYNPARKSIYFLFVEAELLMRKKKVKEAEVILKDVIRRLQTIFPYLRHEASIRSAYLLGVLYVYFEEYRHAGKYMTFLREYNKKGTVNTGSNEYSELLSNLKKFNEIFQSREEFGKSSLNGFDRPF